ncbi:MAG: imidazole glycerol phosphate synthase, glutamine amidotransferase subunit [Chloroflexi bacterium 13_1_40CM_68_21]|nr:MAG: imidazole glycerol phosphate synthase, glutamine amidotransferase subunit [Chloroflexi bacterium 13_1_40CM_68_21]
MIAIVDYGVGNLANVKRGLQRAGAADVLVTRSQDELLSARAVVLPGVGHFGHCARELRRFGLDVAVVRIVSERGIPLLGLCVGMQLLFEGSDEDPETPGLGLYRGRVRKLRGPVRVPHTGWNRVRLVRPHPWLTEVPDAAYFYFVHSYAPEPDDQSAVVGTVEHGGSVTAAVGGENVLGLQFHPEKSGAMGVRALAGFVRATAA